jgi:hypothetical protein
MARRGLKVEIPSRASVAKVKVKKLLECVVYRMQCIRRTVARVSRPVCRMR